MSVKPQSLPAEPRSAASIVQGQAADPARSVWVGASAGTGKTKVLIDRVLRLMLPRADAGGDALLATDPGRILCLTFTKTAAAEMSNRIYRDLADWSVMPDGDLQAALEKLTGHAPDDAAMAAARRLFARVLDTPGGLKIMTIHSFCQSVLKRFPAEAQLPPHFALMDEMTAKDTITQCLHDLIADCAAAPDGALAHAFTQMGLRLNAADMTQLLQQMMAQRARLMPLMGNRGADMAGIARRVYDYLGIEQDATAESIAADALSPHPQDAENLRRLAVAGIDHGKKTKTMVERATVIANWLAADKDARARMLPRYKSVFLTGEGEVRSERTIVTKDVKTHLPEALDIALREAARLCAIEQRLAALRLAEGTTALLVLSCDILARYTAVKKDRDALDFDDLILKTRDLFATGAQVQWVQYKLDQGIDHILVDEAQDTSRAQWEVVAALAREFFSGAGAREDVTRTLFVVGDEKQSIFSFQGAAPDAFDAMKKYFSALVMNMQDGFAVDLQYSFRSTASVLSVVDAVFNRPDVKQGVVHDAAQDIVHLPYRAGEAGHVELWPLVTPADRAEREAWAPALSPQPADNAASRLALQIADTIRGWLDRGERLASQDRPIRAGDVLILTQSRSELVQHLMRALKAAHIPVAGADRMKLRQEIAVMDMLAAARFALQPRDDLTLAALLKSPFCGVGEDALFELCHGRNGSLWRRVQDARADLALWLKPLVESAGRATPYEFFASLLALPCPADGVSGRRGVYARLGRDVADALDEFLNSCLSYEQAHIPALQGFVDWFDRLESDIKREQEGAELDQVRIMTVHASKGLQAPIVFLPDTTKILHAHQKGRVRMLWPESDGEAPLWAASSADQTEDFDCRYAPAAQKQDEEYRRLLYVALTRAEDRLYIAGYQGRRKLPDNCWYNIVDRSFAAQETLDDGTRVLRHAQTVPVKRKKEQATAAPFQREPLPAWARLAPQAEPAPSKPLAPSRPGEDEPAVKSPLAGDDTGRFARGIILHRLLEVLPQLPQGRWPAAMARWLARPAFGLTPVQQETFAAEIDAVLTHPDFAAIFGPGSRAEVPLTGIAGAGTVLAGVVDRLLVTDDEVLVVDYKTNRPPPQEPQDVPVLYLKQMAAYAAVLARIYPDRPVRCALLWTDAARLMPLPQSLLAPYAPA